MDERSDREGETGQGDEISVLIPRGREMTAEEEKKFLAALLADYIGHRGELASCGSEAG